MESKFDPNMPLGGIDLSAIDIVELNKHYHCDGTFCVWCNFAKVTPLTNLDQFTSQLFQNISKSHTPNLKIIEVHVLAR